MPQSEGPISQPQGLISVLNYRAEPFSDRHDAAMDLGEFDDADALACLQAVLSDPSEDADLVDVCRESIDEIRARQDGTR